MATLSVYDINNWIKNHPAIMALLGRQIQIFPNVGYSDENAPFLIYMFAPGTIGVENFWYRRDHVAYLIYDTDVDRMFNIGEILIDILHKGDQISQSGGVAGTDYRILSTEFVSATTDSPTDRDGWYRMDIEFIIYHVKR